MGFFFQNRYSEYFIHAIFWIFYIAYAFISFHYFSIPGVGSHNAIIFVTLIDAATIYFFILYLIPKYLSIGSNKNLNFFLFFVLVILINVLLNLIIQNVLYESFKCNNITCLLKLSHSIQQSLVFILIASGIKMYHHNMISSKKIIKLENEKIQTELEFLKLQMNPHFLFNTLNNIFIQTRIEPEKAAELILKLSDLLRYQIYECSDAKVFIKSEIQYLKDYLDLQKIRFKDLEIKFEQKGNLTGCMIYPFIFISFIENAIKHGVSSDNKNNHIYVSFNIVNKKLMFLIVNSKINNKLHKISKQSGIGLKNVRRRLELLYPNNFILKIKEEKNKYIVELEINLV